MREAFHSRLAFTINGASGIALTSRAVHYVSARVTDLCAAAWLCPDWPIDLCAAAWLRPDWPTDLCAAAWLRPDWSTEGTASASSPETELVLFSG